MKYKIGDLVRLKPCEDLEYLCSIDSMISMGGTEIMICNIADDHTFKCNEGWWWGWDCIDTLIESSAFEIKYNLKDLVRVYNKFLQIYEIYLGTHNEICYMCIINRKRLKVLQSEIQRPVILINIRLGELKNEL